MNIRSNFSGATTGTRARPLFCCFVPATCPPQCARIFSPTSFRRQRLIWSWSWGPAHGEALPTSPALGHRGSEIGDRRSEIGGTIDEGRITTHDKRSHKLWDRLSWVVIRPSSIVPPISDLRSPISDPRCPSAGEVGSASPCAGPQLHDQISLCRLNDVGEKIRAHWGGQVAGTKQQNKGLARVPVVAPLKLLLMFIKP